MGQEDYLKNKQLVFSQFKLLSKDWDHDHCEFCTRKFGTELDDLHEGYSTIDNYYWICSACYDDFKEIFNWTVV